MTRDFRTLQRYGKLVPFEISHIVCVCTPEEKQAAWEAGRRVGAKISNKVNLTMCNNCGKYPRYMVRRCNKCKDVYVESFDHPNKCIKNPVCWACIQDDSPCEHDICKSYQTLIPPDPEVLTKRQPVRAEDISFDFDFGDDVPDFD